ncbi:Holliday junction resolvase RuvX [Ureaplasma parvum]|uniref:Holliday junction resolvase RuvX n=1 Tax=Ureaplasma parvum TaxID=134821 RepID=UPI0026ECEE08|nr:Holliday junction resolvase RuvX [Ureaplasma parvum]
MRKLALDLGTKSCGFAISDLLGIIASGLDNFIYKENDFTAVLAKIDEIMIDYHHEIDTIVLGYPTNVYDGSKNERTYLIESFYILLKQHFFNHEKIKIIYEDERFSTKIATQRLKNSCVKAARIKKVKDKMSAVVILESYLSKNHFN